MNTVRCALLADIPQMTSLLAAVDIDSWSAAELAVCIAQQQAWLALRKLKLVGILLGREIVAAAQPRGYATSADGEAELLEIVVDPFARRQGLATALLSAWQDHLLARGVATIHLEVRASNAAAMGCYTRLGYQVVGQRPGYYPPLDGLGGREAAVLMRLEQ